jgi:hypothetical protein
VSRHDASDPIDPESQESAYAESRWPMAGAVVAAMVLTILLPDDLRLAPRWLLPLVEGLLLVALIAGDPGRISRRSTALRVVSVALISVLALSAIWSTIQLIDDLIHGGAETNSASALLEAGGSVWASTVLAFSLLYFELDGGGSAARAHHMPRHARARLSPAAQPQSERISVAAQIRRLPLPGAYQLHGLQPDRRHAAGTVGQDRHGRPVPRLTGHPGARRCQSRKRPRLTTDHPARPPGQRMGPDRRDHADLCCGPALGQPSAHPSSLVVHHQRVQKWTRHEARVLGSVLLHVDFDVPIDDLRAEFRRLLQESPLWDGRDWVLQVVDTTPSTMVVRGFMSSVDATSNWDLRCDVREKFAGLPSTAISQESAEDTCRRVDWRWPSRRHQLEGNGRPQCGRARWALS